MESMRLALKSLFCGHCPGDFEIPDEKHELVCPDPELHSEEESRTNSCDFREILVGKSCSCDTRTFLEDRLESLAIVGDLDDEQIMKWGLGAVSLFDESALLHKHVSVGDWKVVQLVLDAVGSKMKDLGLALIDEDEWNPSHQRAVSVVRSGTTKKTKILKKNFSGLVFRDRLVKKQEVEVEMPLA